MSLSCGRLNSLESEAFIGSPLSHLSSHTKGGRGGPSSRFVVLVKNYFSLLEFPATERFPNEFSQGCKHTGSYSSLLGDLLIIAITTCFAGALENGLTAVEGRLLDVTQALIKPTAPAVLNHCLA